LQNLEKASALTLVLINKSSHNKPAKTSSNKASNQLNQEPTLHEENKKLAKTLELSQQEITKLKTQISTLLSSHQQKEMTSQKNIDRLSTENNELRNKTMALEKENREVKAKLKDQNLRISELTSSNKDSTTEKRYTDTSTATDAIALTPKEVQVGIINPQEFVLQNTIQQLNAQLHKSAHSIACLTNTLTQIKKNADELSQKVGMLSKENTQLKSQQATFDEQLQKMRAVVDKSLRHLLTDDRFAIVARDIDKTNNNYRPKNGAGFFNRARKVVSNTEIKQLLDSYAATMRPNNK